MSLKNELHDMKINDDDKELVNIVPNGLPKTWDSFFASMNTRNEYPTFE
jgi:hypothetical protein